MSIDQQASKVTTTTTTTTTTEIIMCWKTLLSFILCIIITFIITTYYTNIQFTYYVWSTKKKWKIYTNITLFHMFIDTFTITYTIRNNEVAFAMVQLNLNLNLREDECMIQYEVKLFKLHNTYLNT